MELDLISVFGSGIGKDIGLPLRPYNQTHAASLGEKIVDNMRPDEACGACHQDALPIVCRQIPCFGDAGCALDSLLGSFL